MQQKQIKVKLADNDGYIKDVTVNVTASMKPERLGLFQFKQRRARKAYRAEIMDKAQDMILTAYEGAKQQAREEMSDATPGEIDNAIKRVEAECKGFIKSMQVGKEKTAALMVKRFGDNPSEVIEFIDFAGTYCNPVELREYVCFFGIDEIRYRTLLSNPLNQLRATHPIFAYEDMSDLDPEAIALARRFVIMSENARMEKNRQDRSRISSHQWKSQQEDAAREISMYTPFITHAMIELYVNHADRVEEVMDNIKERGISIKDFDDELLKSILSTTKPLSEGVL